MQAFIADPNAWITPIVGACRQLLRLITGVVMHLPISSKDLTWKA